MSEPELKTDFNVLMIKEYVKMMQKEINRMKQEGKNDPFDHEMTLIETFPDFYQQHPFLVKKICSGSDLSMLTKMLDNLEHVQEGNKSLASVELNLGNELANQFLYPVINKK
jgi:hypothetical protein